MNLKVKFSCSIKRYIIIIACSLLVLVVIFFLKNPEAIEESQIKTVGNVSGDPQKQAQPLRKQTHQELSPDGSKKITRYELQFDPTLFGGNYTTYLDSKIIISVTNIFSDIEREYYIFIGEEKTGEPHWLGNNYVFFTNHCGSSCEGLILLDVRTGQKWQAVLSYLSNNHKSSETYFHDWFDKNFQFDGLVQKIHGLMENNQPYLIFDMENDKGVESGEKHFLFTGNSLILKN